MRKIFYLGFCAVLAMGVGCAITNYELITDNDQYKNGSTVVSTNGKAIIMTGQVATIWPDGTDMLFTMVDQKANGDRTLTTYNWFATGDIPTFKDNTYCNPDWVGCAIITAPDPEVGDTDLFDPGFDGTNENCSGERSLSVLLSTTRYYGECGRVHQNLTPAQRAMALQMVQATELGYFGKFDASDTSFFLTNTSGTTYNLPVFAGSFDLEWAARNVALDLTNPNVATTLRYADNVVKQSADNVFSLTVRWNNLEISRDVMIREGGPADLGLRY
jgi:hypothetical protein